MKRLPDNVGMMDLLLRTGNVLIVPAGRFFLLFWLVLVLFGRCFHRITLMETAVFIFFLSGVLFSLVGHFWHELSLAWREFPYWVDHSQFPANHRQVSLTVLLTVFLLFLVLPEKYSLVLGVCLLLNDFFWNRRSWSTELRVRQFRKLYEQNCREEGIPTRDGCRKTENETADIKNSTVELAGRAADSRSGKDHLEEKTGNGYLDGKLPEDESVFLTQTRSCPAAGIDQMTGWVQVNFETGATVAVVHLAICPPMPTVPEIEVEQESGGEVDFRITQKQPYGIRMEVRRKTTEETEEPVRLAFFAEAGKMANSAVILSE